EKNIRETVAFALKREGYRVNTYADGSEAWNAFRQQLPDLAVLDILMPRMDGRELCRKLRGKSESLPIIFLTSKDEELDRVLGLELGDRKSTRLNSSHVAISYAVFCLKKKTRP